MKKITYILIVAFLLTSCQKPKTNNEILSDTRFVLGTVATIQLYDTNDHEILEGCYEILEEIDQMMS